MASKHTANTIKMVASKSHLPSTRQLFPRIGKCLTFGCDESQTLRAANLIHRIMEEEDTAEVQQRGHFPVISQRKITLARGPPGPFKAVASVAAYEAIAQEATQATLRRAYQLASEIEKPRLRTWPDTLLVGSTVTTTKKRKYAPEKGLRLLPTTQNFDVVSASQDIFPAIDQTAFEISTYIRSLVHEQLVCIFRYKFGNLPRPVLQALMSMKLEPNSSLFGELEEGVRALEKDTWDRPDAVEDVGGAQAPVPETTTSSGEGDEVTANKAV